MSDLTDYFKDHILAHCLYIGLFSSAPSDSGGGTELTGSGYSRKSVTWTRSADLASNANDVTFDAAGIDWLEAGWVGVFDAESAGNLIAWKAITSFTLKAGRTYTFETGNIPVNF